MGGDRLTAYHLEAGIANCHAAATSWEATDWSTIVGYYDRLLALEPSPVTALNRAVAVAMVEGPESGLAAIAAIVEDGALRDYPLLDSVRGELDDSAPKRPVPPLEEHPLVRHYGLPLERLALTKAHRAVEGDHRKAAWRVLLDFVPTSEYGAVLAAMDETLRLWLAYRDEVAEACGLARGADGKPVLAARSLV